MNKIIRMLMSLMMLISLSFMSLNLSINANEVEEIISVNGGQELTINSNGEYHFESDPNTYYYTDNTIIEISGYVNMQTIGEVTVQKIKEVTPSSSLTILENSHLNVITDDEIGIDVTEIKLGEISEMSQDNIYVNIEAKTYGTVSESIFQFNGTYISTGSYYGIVSKEILDGAEVSNLMISQNVGTTMSGIATGQNGVGVDANNIHAQGSTFSGKALSGIGGIKTESLVVTVAEKYTMDDALGSVEVQNLPAKVIGESNNGFGIHSRNMIENIGSSISGIAHNGYSGIETAGLFSDSIDTIDWYDDGQGSLPIETEKYFESEVIGIADVGVGILVDYLEEEPYPVDIAIGGTKVTAIVHDGIGLFASSIELLPAFVEINATASNGYGITLEEGIIAEDGQGVAIWGTSENAPIATNEYISFMKTEVNSIDPPTAAGVWVGQYAEIGREEDEDILEERDIVLHGSAPMNIPGSTGIEIYSNNNGNIGGSLSTQNEKVTIEAKGYIGARVESIYTSAFSETATSTITTYIIDGYKDGLIVAGMMDIDGYSDAGGEVEGEYLVEMNIHAETGTGLHLNDDLSLSSVYLNITGGTYAMNIQADYVTTQYSKIIANSLTEDTITAMNVTSNDSDSIGYINFYNSVIEITSTQDGLRAENMIMNTNADELASDGSYKMRIKATAAKAAMSLTFSNPDSVSEAIRSENSEVTTIATNMSPDTMERPTLYAQAPIVGVYTSFNEIYNQETENPMTTDGSFVYTTNGNIHDYTLYNWLVTDIDAVSIDAVASNESGLAIDDDAILGNLEILATRLNDSSRNITLPKTENIELDVQAKHTIKLTSRMNDVNVTYDLNGGTGNVPATQNYSSGSTVIITNVIPTKSNHTFIGWSDGITTYQNGDTFIMPNNNVILSAQWQADTYQVTYNLDGGSGAMPGATNYTVGANIMVDETIPTKANYTFVHWTDGTTTYIGGNSFSMPANNVVLTAVWIPNTPTNMYTVSYNLNGGSGSIPQPTNYTANSIVVVDLVIPTKQYHTFLYWTDGVNNYKGNDTFLMPTKNVSLSAIWKVDNYTVSYDLDGGVGNVPQPTDYEVNSMVRVEVKIPTKQGYTFLYWTDGTNNYSGNDTFSMPANNVTLTASWKSSEPKNPEEETENNDNLPETGQSNRPIFIGLIISALSVLFLYARKKYLI